MTVLNSLNDVVRFLLSGLGNLAVLAHIPSPRYHGASHAQLPRPAVLLTVAQAQDNPWQATLVRAVKNSVTDTSKPFVLAVRFKIKDAQKFEAAAAKHVLKTAHFKTAMAAFEPLLDGDLDVHISVPVAIN